MAPPRSTIAGQFADLAAVTGDAFDAFNKAVLAGDARGAADARAGLHERLDDFLDRAQAVLAHEARAIDEINRRRRSGAN